MLQTCVHAIQACLTNMSVSGLVLFVRLANPNRFEMQLLSTRRPAAQCLVFLIKLLSSSMGRTKCASMGTSQSLGVPRLLMTFQIHLLFDIDTDVDALAVPMLRGGWYCCSYLY